MDLKTINEATLRLFKSIYVTDNFNVEITEEELVDLASKGILFDSKIRFNTHMSASETITTAKLLYGVNLVELSNTFHKTWKTVEEITPELHYLQQILHYITTYGFDSLGIPYDSNNTYIPAEKVPYEENVTPYNFTIVRAITLPEIIDRLTVLLSSGVALSSQQVLDVVCLIDLLNKEGYTYNFDTIKNKEVKAILWLDVEDKPYINVDEFLRVLTYKVTGNTLLVRSYRNYSVCKLMLKYSSVKQNEVKQLFEYYINKFGMENIASQFLRNKMVFLSFKCDTTKSIINKIRRVADTYHRPKVESYLTMDDIENANIWQLIKYYNLCLSRLNPVQDSLYQIRNGTNYLTENKNYGISGDVKCIVQDHFNEFKIAIENKLKEKLAPLKDKIFLVPDYLDYKVPTSLKRLISGIPEGSSISLSNKSFTIGVHWENCVHKGREYRTDLDLHANSLDGKSISWYSDYKNEHVVYSGDMTDALVKNGGASEALTFHNPDVPYIITLNDYTQNNGTTFKLVFDLDTTIEADSYLKGYIFSPNARVLNSKVGKDQNSLGLVLDNKFYFLNSKMFTGPITHNNELLRRLIKYYQDSQPNSLTFRQLADLIGFKIVSKLDDIPMIEKLDVDETTGEVKDRIIVKAEFTDLSLEAITEDTFPRIFNIEN